MDQAKMKAILRVTENDKGMKEDGRPSQGLPQQGRPSWSRTFAGTFAGLTI